jgi:hypothetical protein
MLAAALPLPFLADARPWRLAAAVGCGLGLAIGVKAHGGIYLLPTLAFLATVHGWRAAVPSLVLGAALSALPFLHSSVSFASYADWLARAASHGLAPGPFAATAQQALLLLLPLLLLWRRHGHRDRGGYALLAGLVVACAVAVAAGSKPLAGPRHLVPLIPVALAAAFRMRAAGADWFAGVWAKRAMAALGLTLTVMAAAALFQVFDEYRRHAADPEAAAEIREILAAHPDATIEMGYSGAGYRLSLLRPLLVFAGNPYSLDAAAVMDMQAAGLPLPRAAIARLERCETELWLLPSGEPPFVIRNLYRPQPLLFDPDFIDAFRQRYRIVERRDYFDVWSCG